MTGVKEWPRMHGDHVKSEAVEKSNYDGRRIRVNEEQSKEATRNGQEGC